MLSTLLSATLLAPALQARTPAQDAAAERGAASDVGVDWIVRGIARPPPASTPFVEIRQSALLKAPLRISGEYRRPDADTLVRAVVAPYVETTTIAGAQVVIERAGRAPRRIPVSRAPELAGLQDSFGAVLAGDAEALRRHYAVSANGFRDAWGLQMTPRDPRLANRLQSIRLFGANDVLRCIETRIPGGEVQRTLLADAATGDADLLRFDKVCSSGGMQ